MAVAGCMAGPVLVQRPKRVERKLIAGGLLDKL